MAWFEWINDNNKSANTLGSTAFSSWTEKNTGFQSGSTAVAKNVNTVLRQNSIVVKALMDSLGVTGDYLSKTSDLQTSITNALTAKITGYVATSTPYAVATESSIGSSTKYAREDHKHKGVSQISINGTPKSGDAGSIYAPTGSGTAGQVLTSNGVNQAPTWQTLINLFHPVGSIYMSVSSKDPGELFGGTWEPWGSGRVPVGVNTSDSDFNSAGRTGGSKSVTLLSTNIPAMTTGQSGNDAYVQLRCVAQNENLVVGYSDKISVAKQGTSIQNVAKSAYSEKPQMVSYNAQHTHTVGQSSPAPVNNLQPYITCYMWKRMA